jgi:adenylyl-sulfate kinase
MRAGVCVWFTGLPCAGKSTLALHLARHFEALGLEVVVFDGDAVRKDVSADLGFSREHRHANALRVASLAREVVEGGGVAVCALVSPYRESRAKAREIVRDARFLEVYVDTPIEICEGRDTKGMYGRARAGDLHNFTGVNDPYEAPPRPDVRVAGMGSLDEAIRPILEAFERRAA